MRGIIRMPCRSALEKYIADNMEDKNFDMSYKELYEYYNSKSAYKWNERAFRCVLKGLIDCFRKDCDLYKPFVDFVVCFICDCRVDSGSFSRHVEEIHGLSLVEYEKKKNGL